MTKANHFIATVLSAGLISALGAPALASEVEYTLDSDHTQVRFSWNHLGFSRPSAQFDNVSGTLHWNEAEPTRSSVEVSMPVASINSHVPRLDKKFKSEEFFNAGQYPMVTFKSRSVERGDGPNEYLVKGALTAHGMTRPVMLDVTLNKAGQHPMMKAPALGFAATTAFDRSDFGMDAYVPMVSDEVQVEITAEAIEADGYAEATAAEAAEADNSDSDSN